MCDCFAFICEPCACLVPVEIRTSGEGVGCSGTGFADGLMGHSCRSFEGKTAESNTDRGGPDHVSGGNKDFVIN